MARGKWVCSYKKTTLLVCFFNIAVALFVLRSLYSSLYWFWIVTTSLLPWGWKSLAFSGRCRATINKAEPPKHPNRCKCLLATLTELFSHCQTFGKQFTTASLEEEYPMSDFEEEKEVVVSAVISRAMEKQKHKPSALRHSFSWVYSPATKEFYVTQELAPQERVEADQEHNQIGEEFVSVKSCFSSSCYSSSMNAEAFYSVKTKLSRCSSLNELDLSKYWRRSIIQEFCHCEGWPFGLCRRALLLPPLPKSPSESWLSRKIQPSANKP